MLFLFRLPKKLQPWSYEAKQMVSTLIIKIAYSYNVYGFIYYEPNI